MTDSKPGSHRQETKKEVVKYTKLGSKHIKYYFHHHYLNKNTHHTVALAAIIMLKESEYFPKDRKRLFRIAALLGIVFTAYLIYYHLTIEFGDYKYTIATIGEVYSDSKSTGRYYSFKVNGETYRETCTTKECRKCKYGDKFIVKYYLNDKNISILITEKKVVDKVESPQEGWDTIPSNILIDQEKSR